MSESTDSSETDVVKLKWLRIDRKTDVIGLTAFLLALVGAIFQGREWLQGPQVEFYSPDRIVLFSYDRPNRSPIVRIGASMSYTNSASTSYSAALRSEEVTMKLGPVISK